MQPERKLVNSASKHRVEDIPVRSHSSTSAGHLKPHEICAAMQPAAEGAVAGDVK